MSGILKWCLQDLRVLLVRLVQGGSWGGCRGHAGIVLG